MPSADTLAIEKGLLNSLVVGLSFPYWSLRFPVVANSSAIYRYVASVFDEVPHRNGALVFPPTLMGRVHVVMN